MRARYYEVFCRLHIVNLAICNDEQDVVERFVLLKFDLVHHLVENMREKGRATQSNVWQVFSVDLGYTYGTENIRVHRVTIKVKAMRDLIRVEVSWNSAKAINWKCSIVIVHL